MSTENVEITKRDINTAGKSPSSYQRELARYLSSFEAGSAYILAFGVSINESADALDIGIPAATGTTVRV